ncbi:MAG: leucine-rich repeat protein [Prevotella sp.]|nr:leucine-rich repeat protein [Prevotella sp.]
MKKSSFLLGGALLLVSLFTTSCKEVLGSLDNPVSSYLELKKSSSILEPGQTCTIEASTISTSPITYKSLNPDKATVDAKGVVTAVDDGEATIVVETAANENYVAGVAEFKVYVRTPDLFDPLTLEAKADGNINISFTNYVTIAPKLEEPIIYSINGGEEKSVTASTSFAVKTGDKVQFKSKNKTLARKFLYNDYYYNQYVHILPQVQCAVYGNAMSMVSPDGNWHLNREIKEKFALGYLFYNATNLVNDETRNLTLPATTLTDSCYFYTFRNCYGLTRAPELPAKEIKKGSYRYMFQNCSQLAKVPAMSPTSIDDYGCYYMFSNCDALTEAPAINVETIGERGCYYMFYNCDALTTAPAITAETVGERGCYYMFGGCTALSTAPDIKLTTLGQYGMAYMFRGCTALTTAPAITAEDVDIYGFNEMFWDCTSMTKAGDITIKNAAGEGAFCWMYDYCSALKESPAITADSIGYNAGANMFTGCHALEKANAINVKKIGPNALQYLFANKPELQEAVAVNAEQLDVYACYQMFNSCPKLEKAPATLPATTLADHCYSDMFAGCTKLEKAPALPAQTLAPYCYNYMFGNCTSLTEAPELKAATLVDHCYCAMFMSCVKLNKLTCLATTMADYGISWMLSNAGTDESVTTRTFTRSTANNEWINSDSNFTNVWYVPTGWTIDPAITAASAPAHRASSAYIAAPSQYVPEKAPISSEKVVKEEDQNPEPELEM